MTNLSLNKYKTINLADYAAQKYNYKVNKEKSTRAWVFLESVDDKILVRKKGEYYFFTSLDNPSDKGSIIDFIQNRTNLNFGEIRSELDTFSGIGQSIEIEANDNVVIPKLISEYQGITPLQDTSYLNDRYIPNDVIFSEQFKGCAFNMSNGKHTNIAFPVFSPTSLVNFVEVSPQDRKVVAFAQKNWDYNNFTDQRGGGLWRSNVDLNRPIDLAIIVENPMKAYAHYILNPELHTKNVVYYSTFGTPSQEQLELLSKIPDGIALDSFGKRSHKPKSLIFSLDYDSGGYIHSLKIVDKLDPHSIAKAQYIKEMPHKAFAKFIPSVSQKVNGHLEIIINTSAKAKAVESQKQIEDFFTKRNAYYQGKYNVDVNCFKYESKVFDDKSLRIKLNFKNHKDLWADCFDLAAGFKFENSLKISKHISSAKDWNEQLENIYQQGNDVKQSERVSIESKQEPEVSKQVDINLDDFKLGSSGEKVSNPIKNKFSL